MQRDDIGTHNVTPESDGMGTTPSVPENPLKKSLITRLQALSENSYSEYIDCCRQDSCLGWEGKIAHGTFRAQELEAHKKAAEAFGRHLAYHRLLQDLQT